MKLSRVRGKRNIFHFQISESFRKVERPSNYLQSTINIQGQPPDVFLEKGVLEIYSKFTGEHTQLY